MADTTPVFEDIFSEAESECIFRVKSQLSDEDRAESFVDDFFILRFLRARGMDVQKAVEMLRLSIQWRRENNVAGILDRPRPPKLDIILSNCCYHKFDKYGRPMVVYRYGQLGSDLSRLLTLSEFLECQKWINENYVRLLQDSCKKHKKRISMFTLIVDMSGLSRSAYGALKYVRAAAWLNQENYPETMGRTFVVRAPYIASVLYNIVKHFLRAQTQRKISLHSDDALDELLEIAEKSDLPVEFGGTCTDCDGKCMPTAIRNIDFLPSSAGDGASDFDMMESVNVGAGKIHEHVVHTGSDGGHFNWYFTSSSDVDFSVHFRKGTTDATSTKTREVKASHEEGHVPVHNLERIPTEVPIAGSFKATERGFCTFRWSNEFSYFRSKTVKFVISCNEHKQELDADTDSPNGNTGAREDAVEGNSLEQKNGNKPSSSNATSSVDVILPWTTRLVPGRDGWKVDCEVKASSIAEAGQGTYLTQSCASGTVLRSLLNVGFTSGEPLKPGTRVRVNNERELDQLLKQVESGGETNVHQKASWYAEPDLVDSSESIYFYVPGSVINHVKPEQANVAYRQVYTDENISKGQTSVEIYALKDLAPGEELFCDYTYLPIYPVWFRTFCSERGLRDVKSFSDSISALS